MTSPLLEACLRGALADLQVINAAEPNPLAAMKAKAVRSFRRDLDKLGVDPQLAEVIIRKVMIGLRRVTDAPGVPLDDIAAALLIAERVLAGAMVAIVEFQRAEATADAELQPRQQRQHLPTND